MSTPHTTSPAADRRTLIADTAIGLVAASGLRGLTHRAVDGTAGLPAGSTSYYFRTRTALIGACYRRLAELDLHDLDAGAERGGGQDGGGEEGGGAAGGGDGPAPEPGDLEAAVAMLTGLLYRWLTAGRERQLARFELGLEAARNPELETEFRRAGEEPRARAAGLLAALGAERPREAAELLVAWTDGLLYDRLAGSLARSRSAPDLAELACVARRMIAAALAPTGAG
ncbi:TetR/AcrR family transcriptional regulator [Streptomyces sp. NBC_01408]|uniref:TetR/AcrR family transcriptional regulator n=1 Tax=Streptomyces sp. NBC_01408 TaxID=2903855 RepID=UPI00224E5840|nr:TetR/AcrR family transcriptional regulator [Streptomyces sp. NBC_01408]MCX4694992.1 TetR family transcriptional regulator [Streptomyces sp. NBC_01408]